MSTHAQSTDHAQSSAHQQLETSLLEIADVTRVIRIETLTTDKGDEVVAAKLSLNPEATIQQVSIVVALAERRIARLFPNAKHVYITPDLHVDQKNAPSTSAIVTLSYD